MAGMHTKTKLSLRHVLLVFALLIAGFYSNAKTSEQNSNAMLAIANHCQAIEAYAKTSEAFANDAVIGSIGRVAYDLFVYRRHHPDLPISLDELCGPAISAVVKHINKPLPDHEISAWQNDEWAKLLFLYLIDAMPNMSVYQQAKTRSFLWIFYNFEGQHKKAINAIQSAIEVLAKVDAEDKEQLSELYNRLFISQLRLGAYSDALESTNKGFLLRDYLSDENKWRMSFNVALLNDYMGEYEMADKYYRLSLGVYNDTSDYRFEACNAIRGDQHQIAYAIAMIGAISRKMEKLDTAKHALACGLKKLTNIKSNHALVAHIESAKLSIETKQLDKALLHVNSVIESNAVIDVQLMDAWILTCKLNRLKQEYSQFEVCVVKLAQLLGYDALDSVPLVFQTPPVYPIRHFELLSLMMQLSLYRNEVEQAILRGDAALSFSAQYRTVVSNPQAWKSARYDFVESFMQVILGDDLPPKEQLFALHEVLEGPYSMSPHDETSLFATLTSDSQEEFVAQTNDFLDLPAIQNKIKPDSVVLRYYHYNNELKVLIVSKNEARTEALMSIEQYKNFIEDYNQSANTGLSLITVRKLAANRLIPSSIVEAFDGDSKLIIVPDKELEQFPFSILNVDSEVGSYSPLIWHTQIVMTHSLSHYFADIQPQKSSFAITLFGAPTSKLAALQASANRGSDYPFLDGALDELLNISKMFKPEIQHLGILDNATSEFLLSSRSRASTILHIATHGYVDLSEPNGVGIITKSTSVNSEDHDKLTLSKLLAYPNNNQLVVISGCDTQQGKLYQGSGVRSMTRGFLSQGAGSVIGTLWPVQDVSAAKFMQIFYQQLSQNRNSALALRNTQLQFSKNHRYKSPRYWAGFVLNSANQQHEEFPLVSRNQ